MKKWLRIIGLVMALLILFCACGDTGETDTETSTDTQTGAESNTQTETETMTETEIETIGYKPNAPVEQTELKLKTKNATLDLAIDGNEVKVTSLKAGDVQYIVEPQTLSLPKLGCTMTLNQVYYIEGDRGTTGFRFEYKNGELFYNLYVSSNTNYGGPFEFSGELINHTDSTLTIKNGGYFDLGVAFGKTPTATTFRKESGSAEGWRLYNGTYYGGSGMYETVLGEQKVSTVSGSCAVIEPSNYSAIFFWTGLHATDDIDVSFQIRGKKGDTVNFGFEDAHATINGQWQAAVKYECADSYTIKEDDTWETVRVTFSPANCAGVDDSGKVWNADHNTNGYPLYLNTTSATSNVYLDDVCVNGQTQTFSGSSVTEGCPWGGSWVPNGHVTMNKNMGYTEPVSNYAQAVASYNTNQDWNAGGDISMMYINTGSNGLYIGHEWSNGRLVAQAAEGNKVSLHAELGSGTFTTKLPSDESMEFPPVYIGVYEGDMDDGSNLYKRWFLNVKAPLNMTTDPNEPLTQQDMQIGYDVSKYGIQSIKWDYGWWSNTTANGSWKTNEGLLEVKNQAYLNVIKDAGCDTLSAFANQAKESGVSLTLYILLKDTGLNTAGVPTSTGSYGHPEWFSNRVVTVGKSADLGNEDCVAFFQEYMTNFFITNNITTWRSDFEPICRSSDKENRHTANGTDVQYWCTVGFEELVDYLIENVPGFRYESCSSGGSMKDLFTMTKASVINCDDSADYMSLHMSFYDSSYCIHPAQLQLPTNSLTYTQGSQYYTGSADFIYGLRCQMTGAVMLSNWKGTNSEYNETEVWETVINKDYNEKLKPLIRNGDLYHILPRPDGVNWDGLEYVDLSAPTIKGAIMLWKPEGASNRKTIVLRGLDPNANYRLVFTDRTDQNCVMSGSDLMTKGLKVTFTESVGSDIIYLYEM